MVASSGQEKKRIWQEMEGAFPTALRKGTLAQKSRYEWIHDVAKRKN
jgi:hypothetical protein